MSIWYEGCQNTPLKDSPVHANDFNKIKKVLLKSVLHQRWIIGLNVFHCNLEIRIKIFTSKVFNGFDNSGEKSRATAQNNNTKKD